MFSTSKYKLIKHPIIKSVAFQQQYDLTMNITWNEFPSIALQNIAQIDLLDTQIYYTSLE
jgi:hypothetical protein